MVSGPTALVVLSKVFYNVFSLSENFLERYEIRLVDEIKTIKWNIFIQSMS